MSEIVSRLIKKKVIYVPLNGILYRRTEILEEIVAVPIIDLTDDGEETTSLSVSCPNTPVGCDCIQHNFSSSGQYVHE